MQTKLRELLKAYELIQPDASIARFSSRFLASLLEWHSLGAGSSVRRFLLRR
ncbi:MAG: hypothetical protein QOC96_2822 [Acidobacteriota bacterium]|jgi:hypothetical protein|nr:hypothetical protein [Acidobacteriota bacterium]